MKKTLKLSEAVYCKYLKWAAECVSESFSHSHNYNEQWRVLLQAESETENDRDAMHPVQNIVIYSTNEVGNAVLVETVRYFKGCVCVYVKPWLIDSISWYLAITTSSSFYRFPNVQVVCVIVFCVWFLWGTGL